MGVMGRTIGIRWWAAAVAALTFTGCGGESPGLAPEPEPEPRAETYEPCAVQAVFALEPGEAAMLPAGDSVCVSFASRGQYALAYFDTASITASLNFTGGFLATDRFSAGIHLQDGTGLSQAGAATASLVGASSRPDGEASPAADVRTASADCLYGFNAATFCRDRPWAVVDTFRFQFGSEPRSVTVVALEGPLALAFWTSQVDAMEPALPELVRLARVVGTSIILFARRIMVDAMVTTSPGSGQLLVLARPGPPSIAYSVPGPDGSSGMILLDLPSTAGAGPESDILSLARDQVLAHEVAHLWQLRYAYGRIRDAQTGDLHPWADVWAVEGGADLFAKEYLRRRLDLPLMPNREERVESLLRTREDIYWNWLVSSRGDLGRGYHHAEPFLRHLLIEQVRAGVDPDEALRTVLLGAMEGWNGQPAAPWAAEGLTRRLNPVLPEGWAPVEGVLTWTLGNALDDRNDDPRYQNHTFADAWRQEGTTGWPAHATVTPRAPRAEVERGAGSTGYFRVDIPDDPTARLLLTGSRVQYGPPGEPVYDTTVFSAVRWMVMRVF